MKGRILTVGILAALALLLSGCDAFRSMAGRPTSEDIEMKRQAIDAQQAARQARLDSLRMEEERIARYKAAEESINSCGLIIITPGEIRSLSGVALDFKYALMLGSFKEESNAVKLSSRLAEKGFGSSLIRYNNGSVAVAASPTDDAVTFLSAMEALRKDEICPADAWVLINQ